MGNEVMYDYAGLMKQEHDTESELCPRMQIVDFRFLVRFVSFAQGKSKEMRSLFFSDGDTWTVADERRS